MRKVVLPLGRTRPDGAADAAGQHADPKLLLSKFLRVGGGERRGLGPGRAAGQRHRSRRPSRPDGALSFAWILAPVLAAALAGCGPRGIGADWKRFEPRVAAADFE